MPITANVTNEQITASVGETQIDVSVSGGVGPSGAAGSNGQAATVAVGTVTTGAAGSQASVTNVGTSSAAVFDFTIPAGATGATGPAGTTTWAGITDKPTFAAVATSGSASDLSAGTLNASRLPASVVRTGVPATGYVTLNGTLLVSNDGGEDPSLSAIILSDGVDDKIGLAPDGSMFCAAITLAGTDLASTLSGKAAASHTHAQLHDRSHAITSSSDHTATAWRVFYSNGSGVVTELAIGASGTVLTSAGASAAPTFSTPPSGGSTNVWIPASAFIPRTTNGCGVDSRETSTNRTNWDELLFDAGADEFAQAAIVMPSNYNAGTITARFYWTASGATDGSDDVIWGIQASAFANDDALDTAFGTAQTVTDTVIATNDMHVSSATSAVTVGGTPAANVPLLIQIYRDADAAGDTYGHDARLLGVEISYTAA